MGEAKHTPSPWATAPIKGHNEFVDIVATVDGRTVTVVRSARVRQATFIVSACNAHEALVKALEGFEIIDCDRCDGTGEDCGVKEDACPGCGGTGEIFAGGEPDQVRAALAKAEGE